MAISLPIFILVGLYRWTPSPVPPGTTRQVGPFLSLWGSVFAVLGDYARSLRFLGVSCSSDLSVSALFSSNVTQEPELQNHVWITTQNSTRVSLKILN